MTQAVLRAEELLTVQKWRYATKKFDASKKIAPDVWDALEASLVLTPSSFGLQPWKFLVVTDPGTRAKLREVSWNQSQVEEASHLVVFLAKDGVEEADVDHFVKRIADVRGVPEASLEGYRGMMVASVVKGKGPAKVPEWAARQCYIALGNFMTSAALLGVDTCPMEGLDAAEYDRILGLAGTGYHTICVCPAGYRSSEDAYATLAKVRFPREEVIGRK